MQSWQSLAIKLFFWTRKYYYRLNRPTLQDFRRGIDKVGEKPYYPPNMRLERISCNAIPTEQLTFGQQLSPKWLFYIHGGGFVMGSPHAYRTLASQLGFRLQANVLMPQYRLAPESTFPAALNDVLNAYLWLHKQVGPENIVLAGDSAGGGLALSLLLAMQEDGQRMPAALLLLAPWADLRPQDPKAPTIRKLAARDPMFSLISFREATKMYAAHHDVTNPFISPLLSKDLGKLPPTMVQTGTHDLLLPNSEQLVEKMDQLGAPATLDLWPKMVHVFQMFYGFLPEAETAVNRLAEFAHSHLYAIGSKQ